MAMRNPVGHVNYQPNSFGEGPRESPKRGFPTFPEVEPGDKRRLRAVYIAGKELKLADRPYDPRQVTDFALSNWTDLYTQARVAELGAGRRRLAAE